MIIEDLKDKFILARWTYLCGDPIVTDAEYERAKVQVESAGFLPDYTERVWSMDPMPPKALFDKYGLDYEKYKLDDSLGYYAESIESLNSYDLIKENFEDLDTRTRVSYKIDGWNCRAVYLDGYLREITSRGRNGSNLDLSVVCRIIPKKIEGFDGFDVQGIVAISGELNIPNNKWEDYKMVTGNKDQRSSVRTAISMGDTEYLSFLAFNITSKNKINTLDSYDYLTKLGFQTPMKMFVESYDQLLKSIELMSVRGEKYNYLTDGLVVENDYVQLALRVGSWSEVPHCSFVVSYSEEYGLTGTYLSVNIYPIEIEGRTIQNVSITNIARIEENGLTIGSPIVLSLRSSANPVIDEELTAEMQRRFPDHEAFMEYILSKEEN